jgi:hypothetical protein
MKHEICQGAALQVSRSLNYKFLLFIKPGIKPVGFGRWRSPEKPLALFSGLAH